MIKFLSICYIVFVIFVTIDSSWEDATIHGYPAAIVIMEVIIPVIGAVGMLLYTFSFKPQFLRCMWKIIPLLLLACFIIEWYFDFIAYRQSGQTSTTTIAATLIGMLVLYPLFYTNFRFGYSKELDD